jgi:hypothetical protein
MRRNYKSKFNELTPIGWVVVGAIALVVLICIMGIILFLIISK